MAEPSPQPVRNLYDTAALRALERRAADALGDSFALMARAGQAAWRVLLARWPQAQRVLVLCGPGNNGGDGYVLAMHALGCGREVRVLRLPAHAPRADSPAALAEAAWRDAGGRTDVFRGALPEADVLVDAVFGIGLTRPPDADTATLLEAIDAHPAPTLALDVPSGVDAATGAVPGTAVHADLTLEFLLPKLGLRTGRALDHVGELRTAALDLEPAWLAPLTPAARMRVADDLREWLAPRPRDSHKGRNGRVLCVGGEHGSGGAVLLCAEAALRCGAGLVEIATREAHVAPALARLPEAMPRAVEDPHTLASHLPAADVLALGPGLGQGEWGRALLRAALATGRPAVMDADALNLLASGAVGVPPDTVLTPHPGEAARLLGIDSAAVQADRLAAARLIAERFRATVILKGAGSLIAAPDRVPCLIAAGNPGMAVGGMGDVLTGVVAALRAQGLAAFDAACAGALLHAAAGDAAAGEGERGLLPRDLMPWLRRLANPEALR